MASTFSNLGLNLQATGENSGTWGALTNVNLQEIDNAISGVFLITLTGNTTLAFTTNSSSTTFTDEAGRNKTIILSGSLSATTVTVTVPNIEKDYYIINNSGATATISSGGSTTVSIATGSKNIVIVNPSVTSVISALPADQVNSPGGTTNSVQYNSAGSFAGSTNFTYDATNVSLLNNGALRLYNTAGTFAGSTNFTYDATNVSLLNNGALRLYNTAGTFYTGLKVAAAAAATATFTLPSADGTSGQAIVTNGSGTLSFGSAGISAGKSIAFALVFG